MKPKKEAKPVADPRHREFTLLWSDLYQQQFLRSYVHSGAKDGSALKAFLTNAPNVTASEWERVAKATWNGRDQWLRSNVVSIAMLCSMWQKCVHQADRTDQPVPMPSWLERKQLVETISVHPANHEWIGYKREIVTPELRMDLSVKRARLKEL